LLLFELVYYYYYFFSSFGVDTLHVGLRTFGHWIDNKIMWFIFNCGTCCFVPLLITRAFWVVYLRSFFVCFVIWFDCCEKFQNFCSCFDFWLFAILLTYAAQVYIVRYSVLEKKISLVLVLYCAFNFVVRICSNKLCLHSCLWQYSEFRLCAVFINTLFLQ
jgi:hypothetical protein